MRAKSPYFVIFDKKSNRRARDCFKRSVAYTEGETHFCVIAVRVAVATAESLLLLLC